MSLFFRNLSASVLLVIAAATSAAQAQDTVLASNTDKVLEIARNYGSAELSTMDDGSTYIDATMGGQGYQVYFYDCDAAPGCATLQFWTYMSAPENPIQAANDWNAAYRFAKVYIDGDGDVAMEMDVNLFGGVTEENLDDTFDWWRVVLDQAVTDFGSTMP